MMEPSKAVFLSYASQDAEAARRICEALRAADIEVWFDQSELRGGDAWDQKIRHQIKDCALFVPIISLNTASRREGYFRLEWGLAEQRAQMIARNMPFIVPVCMDSTPETSEDVPESFLRVQWTRLPGGATPASFSQRITALLTRTEKPSSTSAGAMQAYTDLQPRFGRWFGVAVVGVLVIGVIAWQSWRLVTATISAMPASANVPVNTASTIPEKSIAVLPFVDMSAKKDQEYFSDGLSEELIDLLAKIPELEVIARTSSFSFKGKSDDIPTIAKKLKVANLLEGSVRKSGTRLRVTTQLVRADNGVHIWSETYDRELKDVFQVQDEIAGAVVAALKLRLSPGQQAPSSHRTSNTEAYNQYLLGRRFSDRSTVGDQRRAAEAFRKAIELDPGYAAAYAELGLSVAKVADLAGDEAGLHPALEAADKAVALAPDLADAYAARGLLRYTMWDWSGAQTDLDKAQTLDPSSSTLEKGKYRLLASLGQLPEAMAAAKKRIELDPLSTSAWVSLAVLLLDTRQFAAGHGAIRRALEIQPESISALNILGKLQLYEGNAVGALATFGKENFEAFRLSGVAMAEHSLGHAQESQFALDELIAKDAQGGAFQIAEAYVWRGEKDKAFDWLEQAYKQHDGGLASLKVYAALAPLRGDPRFKALLRKMNLPD